MPNFSETKDVYEHRFQKGTNNIKFSHCTHINSQLALKINELKIISDVAKKLRNCHSKFTHSFIVQNRLWG